MNIYLPIAEVSVNIFVILGLGGVTGLLSGMFGVGGGFLMTPFLIFIGVPPAVSVATSANQIIASSMSGFWAHWQRSSVDFKMGTFLLIGGLIGSTLGVALFRWLQSVGYIDIIISFFYVVFLGAVGTMMAGESIRSLMTSHAPTSPSGAPERPTLGSRLPWQVTFPQSKLTISGFMPIAIGSGIGVLVSMMGIGGGFFLIPAMIYLLGMPTNVVIGTSLFQMIFITANVTFLHAVTTQTVDVLLAIILLTASAIGAQFGSSLSTRISPAHLRALLAALVLLVALKMAVGLFTPPDALYSVEVVE